MPRGAYSACEKRASAKTMALRRHSVAVASSPNSPARSSASSGWPDDELLSGAHASSASASACSALRLLSRNDAMRAAMA